MNQKKVLIIGFGYAGNRFFQVFSYFNSILALNERYEIALVDRDSKKLSQLHNHICFHDLGTALKNFSPDIAVLTVNEKDHFDVLQTLSTSQVALILCEKPLVENRMQAQIIHEKLGQKFFSMNLVERFSPVIQKFFEWKSSFSELRPMRVDFFWGKDRIKDSRPTIGVISEIIHPLDLVKYLFGFEEISIATAISTSCDFSISENPVPDSIDLIAYGNKTAILGHSSFLWTDQRREITGFLKHSNGTYRAYFKFDYPEWDCDQLIIDHFLPTGQMRRELEYKTTNSDFPKSLDNIYKVSEFVRHSLLASRHELKAGQKIVDLTEAVQLQNVLEKLMTISMQSHRTHRSTVFSDRYHEEQHV